LFQENTSYPFYRLFKAYYQNLTHHGVLDIIWTVLPSFFIGTVASASFILVYVGDSMENPILNFTVTGNQWYWTYEVHPLLKPCSQTFDIKYDSYMIAEEDLKPGQFRLLEVDRELVVPYNVELNFEFTSNDVIHSWSVPSLGIKGDCIPGHINRTTLTVTQPGTFYGQCSEICGPNHEFMPIKVVSVDLTVWYVWMFSTAEKNNNFFRNIFFLSQCYPPLLIDIDVTGYKKHYFKRW